MKDNSFINFIGSKFHENDILLEFTYNVIKNFRMTCLLRIEYCNKLFHIVFQKAIQKIISI